MSEHFLNFKKAFHQFMPPRMKFQTLPNAIFGKLSRYDIQYSRWMKVFSTGVIIYSAYFYLKRCKYMNFCNNFPVSSYFYCIKKLFSRNTKCVENKKHNISLEIKDLPEHIKYDMGWFDELDQIKKSFASASTSESVLASTTDDDALLDPLCETTPRGEIIMYYCAETKSFNYYSNSKNIPYSTLDAVARKYVCLHKDPSIYIDIRDEVQKGREKVLKKNKDNKSKLERDCRDAKKSLFATFKNYKTGKNAPKSIHNYDGKVKIEEFEATIKDNINKFIYKGTIEQYHVDATFFKNKQDKRQPDVLRDDIVGNICEIVTHDNDSDYLKLKNEKEFLSYAAFKESLILKK
jgi:hypothetical protein